MSTASSTSGATSTAANEVWRRLAESNGRQAHQPVHAALGRQEPVGVLAVDREGRRLDAGLGALLDLLEVGLQAAPLGPAQVHAQQHLGPVLGVGAALARVDRHDARRRRRARPRTGAPPPGRPSTASAAASPSASSATMLGVELARSLLLAQQVGHLGERVDLLGRARGSRSGGRWPRRAAAETARPRWPGRPRSRARPSRARARRRARSRAGGSR